MKLGLTMIIEQTRGGSNQVDYSEAEQRILAFSENMPVMTFDTLRCRTGLKYLEVVDPENTPRNYIEVVDSEYTKDTTSE